MVGKRGYGKREEYCALGKIIAKKKKVFIRQRGCQSGRPKGFFGGEKKFIRREGKGPALRISVVCNRREGTRKGNRYSGRAPPP